MIIRIKNMSLQTILGIHDWEKTKKRDIIINLELEINGSKAAISDAVEDTVDYDALTLNIKESVESQPFGLIERLADHILKIAMTDQKIQRAKVEVDKPGAIACAESVAVVAEMKRN